MITQDEIRKYAALKTQAKETEALIETMRADLIGRNGEEREPGMLDLNIIPADKPVTQWKAIVERVKELHPELAGNITTIEAANRKMTEGVFQLAVVVKG